MQRTKHKAALPLQNMSLTPQAPHNSVAEALTHREQAAAPNTGGQTDSLDQGLPTKGGAASLIPHRQPAVTHCLPGTCATAGQADSICASGETNIYGEQVVNKVGLLVKEKAPHP